MLDAAVQIADDFLDHGTIVSAQGRAEDANFRIEARPGDISQRSQAGAFGQRRLGLCFRDPGRGLARQPARAPGGRRTYGKGTVQTIMPLSDGMALKITTSRYFTPAGISINGIGIVPDVVL